MERSLLAKQAFVTEIQKHVFLTLEAQEYLLGQLTVKHLTNGRILALYEGSHFFVGTGTLKKENAESLDIAHFLFENDFGIVSTLDLDYDFVALESTMLLVLAREDLDYLLARSPELLAAYHKLVAYWATQRNYRAKLLLLSAAERKNLLIKRWGALTNRISNKDLASYLGINVSYYSTI